MLISLCIPVHNRTYDLKVTMPYLLAAAEASPLVEIVIVDYNSPDDLIPYIAGLNNKAISYVPYIGRNHYHMAHARNLSVKAAQGEYVVIMSADIYPVNNFVQVVREMLEGGYVWMHGRLYTGAIVCQRQEFLDAGGYDERFEFYGPEDKDLHDRLARRGGKFRMLPNGLLSVIETPNEEKIKNYRLPLSKREMHRRGMIIYKENKAAGLLVANEGLTWGVL